MSPEASAGPAAGPPPLSRLALVALGLNIPCFLPPFTIVAAVLGGVAAWRIARHPSRISGMAIAIASIVLGVVLTAVCTPYWWHASRLMLTGPQDAIHAAYRSDHSAVRAAFVGEGATATDMEIDGFAQALRERYGSFLDARTERLEGDPPRQGRIWSVPYRLRFERASVTARVDIATWDEAKERSTIRLSSISVEEPGMPPLRFPGGSSTLSPP